MRTITELKPDDIRELGKRFQQIADTYMSIAIAMEQRNLKTIPVPGIPTLETTIERLLGSVGSTHRALMRQKSLSPTVTAALDQAEAVAKKMLKKKGE